MLVFADVGSCFGNVMRYDIWSVSSIIFRVHISLYMHLFIFFHLNCASQIPYKYCVRPFSRDGELWTLDDQIN